MKLLIKDAVGEKPGVGIELSDTDIEQLIRGRTFTGVIDGLGGVLALLNGVELIIKPSPRSRNQEKIKVPSNETQDDHKNSEAPDEDHSAE